VFALYQGTTLVVPSRAQRTWGFSPCAFSIGISCIFYGGRG
jgi:hypothetical protein